MTFEQWWQGMGYSPEDSSRGKAREAWDTKSLVAESLLDQIKTLQGELTELKKPKVSWRESSVPIDPRFQSKIHMVRITQELSGKDLPEVMTALDQAGGVHEGALKLLGYTPGEGEPNDEPAEG